MWKYVTCCLKDTFQRSANYFDVRCGAGFTASRPTNVVSQKDNRVALYQNAQRCSGNFDENNTRRNEFNWHQCHLLNSWINAFTWSGAIVLGWYASQLHCLNNKRKHLLKHRDIKKRCITNFITFNPRSIQKVVLPPILAHPSNENTNKNLVSESSIDTAIQGLVNVLNSVENKLGLAAIENGDYNYGIEMLQSAAQRKYPPAIYNLAVCYQRGIGVRKDDKSAVYFYQTAASLDHPGAMYNLAILHGQGRGGLDRNPETAEKFLQLAALKGNKDAIKALSAVNLSKDSVAEKDEANLCSNNHKSEVVHPYTSLISIAEELFAPKRMFVNIIAENNSRINDHQDTAKVLSY